MALAADGRQIKNNYSESQMKLLLVCMLLGLSGYFVPAQASETQEVFKHFQDRIVQIHILESSSGARVELGSGFRVSPAGEIVTNYHVVSDVVFKPEKYRGEIVYFDGHTSPMKLVNFDVVHDLAIVSGDLQSQSYFDLYTAPLQKGTRAFSIGTPLDLGFTIVEGTYNGQKEDSQYEQIHFTGSINPGMSGGPTILDDGRVIGVNVATMGNQVGFLVPAKFVTTLLRQTPKETKAATTFDQLAAQLLGNQMQFVPQLVAGKMDTVNLGPYLLPGKISSFLKCWGDTNRNKEDLYQHLSYSCSSEESIYISRSHEIRFLEFTHEYIASEELGQQRFFKLYTRYFGANNGYFNAGKEDVTKFRCQSDFVEHAGLTMRTVLCMRAYKKLPGLYDAVLKVATLGNDRRGVLSTLQLGGFSYDNAILFSRKYLESIAWKK